MTLTAPRTRPPHLPALDGLRAIAALLVLFSHADRLTGLSVAALKASPLLRFSLAADSGVDLFFVLSGFLITAILDATVRAPRGLATFWTRRALRIFPLAYLYLVVIVALNAGTRLFAGDLMPASAWGWLGFFLYVSNLTLLVQGAFPPELVILWSLALEEQFYLLWPLLIRRHTRAELVHLALAMIALAPLLRVAAATIAPNTDAFYFFTLCHMDPIFVGAGLALAWGLPELRGAIARAGRIAVLPAAAILIYVLQTTAYPKEAKPLLWIATHYSVVALCWGAVVARALDPGPAGRALLANRVLAFVGRISYGLYLWHPLVSRLVRRSLGALLPGPEALLLVHLALSIGVASVSFYAFERPILRWKERWRYP